MIIEIDHHRDQAGNIEGVQFIDTDDPQVVATLAALNGSPAKQAQAGYSVISRHAAALPNETRWGKLVRHATAPTADAKVQALNLK